MEYQDPVIAAIVFILAGALAVIFSREKRKSKKGGS
jgi:hypothetical protein